MMTKSSFFFLLLLFCAVGAFAQGADMSDPLDAGEFGRCGGRTFVDWEDVTDGYWDDYGTSSNDVFYLVKVVNPVQITITTCGSDTPTLLYLLDESGSLVTNGSINSSLCSPASYTQQSIQITLQPGIYYVVSEADGPDGLVLYTTIKCDGLGTPAPGDTFATAIDAGTITPSTPFVSTLTVDGAHCFNDNNSGVQFGVNSADVYYKFNVTEDVNLSVTHAGSEAYNTRFVLLDNAGDWFEYDINGYDAHTTVEVSGPRAIWLVCEGYINDAVGSITTTISVTPVSSTSGPTLPCSVGSIVTAPSSNQNYIVSNVVKVAGLRHPGEIPNRNSCEVNQMVQYFDGLGRPLQTLNVKASADGSSDIVQPFVYDDMGREIKKYLPYAASGTADGSFRSNALTSGQGVFGFYNPSPGGTSGSQMTNGVVRIPDPFAETQFEVGPSSRPLQQGAPGSVWQLSSGHTTKMQYRFNTSSSGKYPVKRYQAIAKSGGAVYERELYENGYYPADALYVNIIKDENWSSTQTDTTDHTTEEYKDKEGRVVLKRNWLSGTVHSTYYVYDHLSQLTYVLSPKAEGDAGGISQTVLDNLCYQYAYDELGRPVEKKIPGKGWEYMVYNTVDQVVLTQDANQRANNQWMFTKYDAFGRIVLTGLYANGSSRSTLQTVVDAETTLWETVSNTGNEVDQSGVILGYTNIAYPSQNCTILGINYFDNYNYPYANLFSPQSTVSTKTKGLSTCSRKYLVDGSISFYSINYYDDKARVIERIDETHLAGYPEDRVLNTYSFSGELLSSTRTYNGLAINNTYEYDHVGRKIKTWQQTGGGANILLSKNDYNEIGQLEGKHLHSENSGTSYLQDIGYTYNERGWLLTAASSKFSIDLRYNSPSSGTGRFNGDITQQLYSGDYSGSKSFNYYYDELNRLDSAVSTGGSLDESLTYDKMGNVMSLTRGGNGNGSLTYTYEDSGSSNRLSSVSGYQSRSFTYDANGNAESNGLGKGLEYNILNLPKVVKQGGSTIATYTYLASGEKLQSTGSDGTRDYINGIVYHNGSLDFIETEEGRVDGSTYSYVYDLKDHLGNVRVSIDKDPTTGLARVVQEDEYYALGLNKNLYNFSNNNRYLYNGKEEQTDLTDQYDYGARFYDPVIASWTTVDPSAEKDASLSPYIYGFNNPVRFTDPDGRWPDEDWDPSDPTGNGLSIVENVYLEARDNIASGISTVISWGKSLFSDSPMQEGKVTYSNGQASLSMTNVPEGGKLGAMANAGLNVLGSIPGGGPTAGIFAKAPGIKTALVGVAKDAAKAIHGNSKLSTAETTLYRLETAEGKYLKTGITSKAIPEKRYTNAFMADKKMTKVDKGSRANMLQKEREIVKKTPGPLNKEPWAGKGSSSQ